MGKSVKKLKVAFLALLFLLGSSFAVFADSGMNEGDTEDVIVDEEATEPEELGESDEEDATEPEESGEGDEEEATEPEEPSEGDEEEADEPGDIDEPAGWAQAEVAAAIELGLVPEDMQNGYANNITRADFSRLIVNLLTVKTGKSTDELLADAEVELDASVFTDTDDEFVLVANALGIVNGRGGGTFDPDGEISRQDAAVMLTRAAKVLGMDTELTGMEFADADDIAEYAVEGVAFVSAAEDATNQSKVMGGTGNNNFSPQATYTRQQAFITMKRLYNVGHEEESEEGEDPEEPSDGEDTEAPGDDEEEEPDNGDGE